MSQNTVRLHLNTMDSRPNGSDISNNADVIFDLRKVGIQASPGKILTASLIKASLPTTLTSVISDTPAIVFQVTSATAPNVAGDDLTIYLTGDKSSSGNFTYSATEKRNIYYAIYDYSIGNQQLIGFLNEVVQAQLSTAATDLFELTQEGRLQVTNATFLFKNLNNAMSRRLGIDYKSSQAYLDTPLKYKMTSYQEPIIVTTNLNLNSVGSNDKGSQSNILSSIPIDLNITNLSSTQTAIMPPPPVLAIEEPIIEEEVKK